jgi:TonB-linked SusC/RagA family outer membrane protein
MLNIKKSIGFVYACIASVFFVQLHAQEAQDSTATSIPSSKLILNGYTIKGTVFNAKNKKPLSGISVAVENFTSTFTEDDGSFKIVVPNYDAVLKVSGQDFQTKVFPVKNRKFGLEIFMNESNYAQAYQLANSASGHIMQYNSTQAATVVNFNNNQWSNPSHENVGAFLQGKVSGLNVTRNSGTPGAGSNLSLRGFSSLYGNNKPLIVVDGMIYDDEDYGSGIISNNVSSPFANIDVKDIEDVTVLKDGTSLYGSKGSNGVINITTNRPTEVTTKIDFAMYAGVNERPENYPLLDANGLRTHFTRLASSKGLSQQQIASLPFLNDTAGSPGYYLYQNNTDWQDQVLQQSMNQNYYLKVRGGDEIAKYGLSLNYLDSDGIVGGTNTQRYGTRLNASLRLTKKFNVDANLSFINNVQKQWSQGAGNYFSPLYSSLIKAPFLSTNSIDDSGNVSPILSDVDIFNRSNPNAILAKGIANNNNYRFFGNFKFSYYLNNSLDLNTIIGLTLNKERENFFTPDRGVTDFVLGDVIIKNQSGSDAQSYQSSFVDTYLNYSKNLKNDHNIVTRLGFRAQSSKSENDYVRSYNSPTDDFTFIGTGSLSNPISGGLAETNWLNIYANANYDFRNKYFLTASYAVDGSSRFGDGINGKERLSLMTAVSGAWMVSSEKFLKNSDVINYLKLRASISESGNDGFNDYIAQKQYVSQGFLGFQGLVLGNIGNPDLKPERQRQYNLGVDFGLLKERLNVTVDFFSKRTNNMTTFQNISTVSGFDSVLANNSAMKTTGAETTLNARVISSPDFTFDFGLNIASYQNKIQNLANGDILSNFAGATYVTSTGMDANLFYGLQTNGVYSTTQEATADGLSRQSETGALTAFKGGDMRFIDQNGDKIIDNKDRKVIGNPNPDFFGSFNGNFTYKRFTLNAQFNFSVGNDLYNGLRYNLEKMSGYDNQSIAVANSWRAEGQQTNIPRATFGDPMGNSEFSDRWIEDGSYLRLKTLVVSYDFDVEKMKYIKYIKIYTTANNLFVFTKYLGFDPEFSATSSLFGQGVDVGMAPQFRSIQLGLRLGL